MREKLNENPLAQVAAIAVLLAVGVVMLMSMGGSGSESESESTSAPASVPEATASASSAPAITPAGETPATEAAVAPPPAPAPPKPVTAAFESGQTVVLLIVREGGIDDRLVRADSAALAGMNGVSLFVVPARHIARYAAITEGVGVNRVPALVVVRPKGIDHGTPTASVSYGYQGTENVIQDVVDARYRGRTLSYHP